MLALLLSIQQPNIDTLNQLAKARDVAGLTAYLAEPPKQNPFSVLKTGGAYAAGQKGWAAIALNTPNGDRYIVFSTPIIEEDMGELLFSVNSAGKLTYIPEWDNRGVDLDSHDFDVRFDLPNHKLIASDHIKCHWTAKPRNHFFFRISPTYTVRSMTDSHGKPVPYQQAGGIVAVEPGSRSLDFKVKYDGTNLMPAFNKLIGPNEATLSGSVWYLTIARHPAPYDITLHCPGDWTAIAQGDGGLSGVAYGDSLSGGSSSERTFKFHNPLPVIWYSASEGPYKTIVDKINGREYATMSARMTDEQMHDQNLLNSEVVEFYSKSFMRYPFKRWTSLDSQAFSGGPGALEAYSFATYPGGLPDQDSHEPSHTWWGGILNNDYLHSLWNESFAVYSQGLFARNRASGNKQELAQAFGAVGDANSFYNAAPISDSGDPIGPAAAVLGYGKGGSVLHMLETEIGTESMIKCMSTWVHTNPSRHIGSWEDFEKVVDKVTGKDYTWFFDQWVRRPGYPQMSLSNVAWSNGTLTGMLTFKGDPYRINADLLMRMSDGSDHFVHIDTMQTKDADGYRFSAACPQQPSLISVDPWMHILRERGQDDYPSNIFDLLFSAKKFIDPSHADYLKPFQRGNTISTLPADLSGIFLIGSPETTPAMNALCDKVGFSVTGNKLTYNGTTIDLDHGGAVAIVDLENGKRCLIGLGKCNFRVDSGFAHICVFDEYGRPMRAKTDPVTVGPLTYRFP